MLDNLTNTTDRKAFFNISSQPVIGSFDSTSAADKKMLTNADTGEYIAVVNDCYRVVENHELLIPLHNQMIKYFDPCVIEDVKIKDVVSPSYRASFSEYVFPKINREVGYSNGNKTTIGLRFIMKNTFDGGGCVVLYSGDIDFFCTNGRIVGEYDVTKRRHTRNFTVDGFITAFEKSIERFNWTLDLYQKYADAKITNTYDVRKLFETLTNKKDQSRKGLSDRLFAQYISETLDRGSSVFSVMSALTYYSSHTDYGFSPRGKSDDTTLYARQERVSNWLGSKVWSDFVEKVAA